MTDGESLEMVTELMDGDLRGYLRGAARTDPLYRRVQLLREAAAGLLYLHSQQVVHRDIKPENFLLQGLEEKAVVKVCDFGLSRIKDASHVKTARTGGTLLYIAPEVHRGEPFDERSDVRPVVLPWLVGVVIVVYFPLCVRSPCQRTALWVRRRADADVTLARCETGVLLHHHALGAPHPPHPLLRQGHTVHPRHRGMGPGAPPDPGVTLPMPLLLTLHNPKSNTRNRLFSAHRATKLHRGIGFGV